MESPFIKYSIRITQTRETPPKFYRRYQNKGICAKCQGEYAEIRGKLVK